MWHILSIGHDPLLLETRKMLLEIFGCTVITVTNVAEAVTACQAERFDAAVLCHTLESYEIEAATLLLRGCAPALHILRLQQHEDVTYDPIDFVHRVQSAASSIPGAA